MFRPYLKILALCGLACVVLTFAAQVLGATQSPISPIQAFKTGCENQPQPCWFGVRPGVTSQDEMLNRMAFTGPPSEGRFLIGDGLLFSYDLPAPWPFCYAVFSVENGIVTRAELSLCREPVIQVGDLAALWSNLRNVVSNPPYELVYGTATMNVEGWPTPYSRVLYITLLSPDSQVYRYPWYGFITQEHYCKLTPHLPRCRNQRK
ncbi:MAG: hypothetical protein ABI690_29720 [Chloroflexota bacterium]